MFKWVLNSYISVACKEQRNKVSYIKNLKHYGPFLWMRFNFLKATEPLPGDSWLFTAQSPGVPGTLLINFNGLKDRDNHDLEATLQIWIWDPVMGIQHLNH